MGLVDVAVLVVVLVAAAVAVRSLVRSRVPGGCAGCAGATECQVARTGRGDCPVAGDMLASAERSAGAAGRREGR